MLSQMPNADNVVRDDFTTSAITGGGKNDHLIHHRDPSVLSQDSVDLSSFGGDDILEGSVPSAGQIHMFASKGDDWMILDVAKRSDAIGTNGHHVYGGHGQDTFQFVNIHQNEAPILGRLDDFDPTSDRIMIEDTEIDLTDLPQIIELSDGSEVEVRIIEIEHPEFVAEGLGTQQFLAIGDDIFYALEGARDLGNGNSGLTGEERHFLAPDALETLRSAETVQYENPENFVPRDFYEHREDDLKLDWNPKGDEVWADTGNKSAAHMFGSKGNHHQHEGGAEPVMRGSAGDDVIEGNSGNDTLFGEHGNDLISGGIDDDSIQGGTGNDMIWGGDGNDIVHGGKDDDYISGGKGNDVLGGGDGHDTIFGGEGDNTLTGGGGGDAINRFHFYDEPGQNIITDFKVGYDLITLQDDINSVTVELYENEDGNTVINYGEAGSVELRGVSLDSFQEAAEIRAEENDPIITISTDPEEELLQELRSEIGYYGDAEPPALEVEGIQYGATPFQASGAGGYRYVSEDERDDGRNDPEGDHGPGHGHGGHDHDGDDDEGLLPGIPTTDDDDDDDDMPGSNDDDTQEDGLGTCFIATAAYRDPWHPDVVFLRAFRDEWLVHRAWGRAFVAFYWIVGPKLAGPVRRHNQLARPSKALISGIVRLLSRVWG